MGLYRVSCTSALTTRGRRTHAHPTKLVLALLAGHVAVSMLATSDIGGESCKIDALAAAVLLYSALALAALLRVALDPIRRFAVVLALLQPHLRHVAYHRAVVRIDVAAKAELVVRGRSARHDRHNGSEGGPGRSTGARDGVCA